MTQVAETTSDNPGTGLDCFAITPSDTVNYARGIARAIYVGVTGDVVVVTPTGSVVTWTACPAGFILPCASVRVNSTNTHATNLVGIL